MSDAIISIIGPIVSLLYILSLIMIYIKQKKIITIENKIFTKLLIITPIVLIINIVNTIGPFYLKNYNLYIDIINTIYLLFFLAWILIFTYYIFTTNSKLNYGLVPYKENPYIDYFENAKKNFIKIFIVLSIITLVLRIDHIIINHDTILFGPSYRFVSVIIIWLMIYWLIIMHYNRKKIRLKKNIPNIICIISMILCYIVEYKYPILQLYSTAITFTTLVLYFCIENPDIKLIEDLNIATKQAEKANSDKTQFLIDMYHEIKNPLKAIFGFSEALKGEKLNRKSMSEAEEIYSSSNHLLKIINKLLEIADIETGKVKINNEEYDSYKLFDSVATLGKIRLSNKNVKFIYKTDQIPPVLYGDATRIKQILMNLITNATRYTEEGFITFTIKTKIEQDNCHLTIMIDDSGQGMSEEEQETAFNSYSHIHISSVASGSGSGLGLALTKRLLEAMGGTILLVSDRGKGSRFTIVLTQKIANKTKEEISVQVPKEIKFFDASNTKVLVVDDNKVNLRVAKHLLKEYKIEADTCESGFECIDKIKAGNKYDLIFMDEVMPTITGTETLTELIKISNFHTYVIALTANSDPEVSKQCKMIGYNDFLEKPIDKYELYQILKKYAKSTDHPRENIFYKI